jgi:hypothetical protein
MWYRAWCLVAQPASPIILITGNGGKENYADAQSVVWIKLPVDEGSWRNHVATAAEPLPTGQVTEARVGEIRGCIEVG